MSGQIAAWRLEANSKPACAKPGPSVWRCIRNGFQLGVGITVPSLVRIDIGTHRTQRLTRGSRMRWLVTFATGLALSLSGSAGGATAHDASQPETPAQTDQFQKSNEVVTAVDGNAAAMGPGDASASPGTVTRGAALLGPDGSYNVSDSAPSNVSISGDTEVIAPPSDTATTNAISCSSYGSWYDAQVAYEAAGTTAADPAMVQALDPDFDGIACEEGM